MQKMLGGGGVNLKKDIARRNGGACVLVYNESISMFTIRLKFKYYVGTSDGNTVFEINCLLFYENILVKALVEGSMICSLPVPLLF